MSLNDTTIQATKGSTIYPGVANPHPCPDADPMEANFVPDPTTETRGAGAGENFAGGKDAARALGQLQTDKKTAGSGVVEGRSGIIESTHIDPLDERSNDDDGWAADRTRGAGRPVRVRSVDIEMRSGDLVGAHWQVRHQVETRCRN